MYVVAAREGQPALPAVPRPGQLPVPEATLEPVGTRHAVAGLLGTVVGPLALCGVDVRGWRLFPGTEFSPGHPASCQRCAQLVVAVRTGRADGRAAGGRARPLRPVAPSGI